MDLGYQCAYTGIRSLPIEGHVKKKLFSLCFLSYSVYRAENNQIGRQRPKRFSRFLRRGTRGSRVDNGRKWKEEEARLKRQKMAENGSH